MPAEIANEIHEQRNDSPSQKFDFLKSLENFKLHAKVLEILLLILLPLIIWLGFFVIFGVEDLPKGSIFVLVVLGCGGRLMGYLAQFLRLPPMLGMLGLGLFIRNVPYFDYGKYLNPSYSSPIRQIALAVILTRAGLGLNLAVLNKSKILICLYAIIPTLVEATFIAIISNAILHLPWTWSFLLGFVLAPVSPAVVVPRLLQLNEQGFGVNKGIPSFIIAAACLDNVFAICAFGVFLNFVFPAGTMTYAILQAPLQILVGIGFGISWGFFLGILFDSHQKMDVTFTLVRFILTLGGGIISVVGFTSLGYSGGGAMGCLLSSFCASNVWNKRNVYSHEDPLKWGFWILWYVFEPLLFGIIGCQINIMELDFEVVKLGLICIVGGILVRFLISYFTVSCANLTVKEKLFTSISWIPKATVQAAIGPMALDMANARLDPENQATELDIKYAQTVLTMAVLIILITSAIGEMGVIYTGPKFLTKQAPETALEERGNP